MARRKKHPEDHDNHERWLISYADFITLLFAFFVVMYAISSVNEGKYRVLSDSLTHAFRSATKTPGETLPTPQAAGPFLPMPAPRKSPAPHKQQEKMRRIAKDILQVLGPLVRDGQVRVTESSRGIAVEINASVLFEPGQATLHGNSVQALQAVGRVLAGVEHPVQVEGHTDDTPISTAYFPSNWELSAARASSVVRLFVETGVAAPRLTAVGYGDNRPVRPNDGPENRARNRRVTVMILSAAPEQITEVPLAPSPGASR